MSGILGLAAPRADLGGPYLEATPSTFGERFQASWDEAQAPNRWFQIEGARRDKWQAVIDSLQQATGKTYDNPLAFVPGAGSAGPDGQVIDPVAVRKQREQAIIQAHAEATRDVGAELPDPNMIEPQIQEESRALGQRAASLVDTGGGMGAFFGAATAPTPENLAGFLIPPSRLVLGAMPVARGFLANVGREALFQAGANAALTGASDLADVATGAKQMSDIPGDVAGAAAFGGVLGGVFHTPAALWERWNALPQAARDAAPLETKDAFNVLEREALFSGTNRLGLPPDLHERYQGNALDAIMRNTPLRLDEVTPAETPMTALGTILQQDTSHPDIRVPSDIAGAMFRMTDLPDDEITAFARQAKPNSFARLDKVEGQMADLQGQLQQIDRAPNLADLLDEPAATKMRAVQEELSQPGLSRVERQRRLGSVLSQDELRDPMISQLVIDAANQPRTQIEAQLARLQKQRVEAQATAQAAIDDLRRKLGRYADLAEPKPEGIAKDLGFKAPDDLTGALQTAEFNRLATIARESAPNVGTEGRVPAPTVPAKAPIEAPPAPEIDVSGLLKGRVAADVRKELAAELEGHDLALKDAKALQTCAGGGAI